MEERGWRPFAQMYVLIRILSFLRPYRRRVLTPGRAGAKARKG
jgi:hypothetical protein